MAIILDTFVLDTLRKGGFNSGVIRIHEVVLFKISFSYDGGGN